MRLVLPGERLAAVGSSCRKIKFCAKMTLLSTHFWVVLAILGSGMWWSVKAGKLTVSGALTGGLMGGFIFLGAEYIGLALLGLFFTLASIATAWQRQFKQNLGLAEANKGRRQAGQVFANAGIAATLGLLAWAFPERAELLRLMLAASLAAATADTLSSELGNVYGRRFYNILTWRRDTRGQNGVISREGTGFGVLGSIFIGLVYGFGFGWSWLVLGVILAGTLGNLADSVLGATLERRGYLSNDAVNFLNTLVAALVGGVVWWVV